MSDRSRGNRICADQFEQFSKFHAQLLLNGGKRLLIGKDWYIVLQILELVQIFSGQQVRPRRQRLTSLDYGRSQTADRLEELLRPGLAIALLVARHNVQDHTGRPRTEREGNLNVADDPSIGLPEQHLLGHGRIVLAQRFGHLDAALPAGNEIARPTLQVAIVPEGVGEDNFFAVLGVLHGRTLHLHAAVDGSGAHFSIDYLAGLLLQPLLGDGRHGSGAGPSKGRLLLCALDIGLAAYGCNNATLLIRAAAAAVASRHQSGSLRLDEGTRRIEEKFIEHPPGLVESGLTFHPFLGRPAGIRRRGDVRLVLVLG